MGTCDELSIRIKVDLEVMAAKVYSTFSKHPELKSHHSMQLSLIPRTPSFKPSSVGYSQRILSTQYIYIYIHVRGSFNKFPDFFSYGHFYWYYTPETLVPFEVISSSCNALVVPFQQLLEGPMESLMCERINGLRHSLFHLLNCLKTIASELRE